MDSCGAGGVEDVHVGVVIVGVYGVSVVVVAAGAEGGGGGARHFGAVVYWLSRFYSACVVSRGSWLFSKVLIMIFSQKLVRRSS